jgi:hypothetical protein
LDSKPTGLTMQQHRRDHPQSFTSKSPIFQRTNLELL